MVIYFHGWTKSVKDISVLAMRSAYAGYNIATVDWSYYASDQRYLTKVIPQLRIVRKMGKVLQKIYSQIFVFKIAETFSFFLHQFLENGYDIEQLHLAGHSLG